MLFGGRRKAAADGAGDAPPEEIGPAELVTELAAAEPPLVLDVRSPAEYAEGHIPNARLIPVAELASRLAEVPQGQPVVCVCRSGHRSGIACRLLRSRGYAARNLTGGMLRWTGRVVHGTSQ